MLGVVTKSRHATCGRQQDTAHVRGHYARTLCGAIFWILGIPSAALWGMVTVVTSVLPVVGAASSPVTVENQVSITALS